MVSTLVLSAFSPPSSFLLLSWLGFPGGAAGKELACNAGDPGSILWAGKIPWTGEWLPTPVF